MPAKIQLPPAKSFEEIWAIIQETDRLIKEGAVESDKRFKEIAEQMKESAEESDKRFKEIAEQMKESAEEADRRFKETGKLLKETGRQLGDVHNRLGELVEHIIVPNILQKVKPLGYKFKYVRKRCEFMDKNFRLIAEADIVLINGEYIMIIEVKTVLKVKDVDNHLERLERIRRDACPPDESHRLIGCVAGAVVDEAVKRYAHKKGFYVLEQSGDTLKLDVPEGFNPRMW
jgi:hypothetical protein